MARYSALIEYDGTDYFGFQRQIAKFATIQGEIERVITKLIGSPIYITGAGRTDTGVHASGQVISFTTEWHHGAEALKRALNAKLPDDIAILELIEVADQFHPRYDARRRAYRYCVLNRAVRSPIHRRYSWHVRKPLKIERMNEAASLLLGVHDFATFGVAPQGRITIREIFTAQWQQEKVFLVFSITANAFLYRMVRSLVGSLVAVGLQNWHVSDFEAAFKACDRNKSAPTAPPQGLFLAAVDYD